MIFNPCAGKIEIADDFRSEQRNRVGGDGIAEARVKFLGDGGTADDVAAFEYQTFEAGLGQIERADEPVVTGADDDGVMHG